VKHEGTRKEGRWEDRKKHGKKRIIETFPMKNFWESGRGWQPRPIREDFNVFPFSPMTNDK